MKNLFFFNQRSNAAAQATECAYTTGQNFGVNPTKTSTFGRLATYIGLVLVMLVTLGVGEMKAGAGFYEVYFTYSYNGTSGNATYTSSTSSTQTIDLGTLSADFKITSMYLKYWKEGSGNMCGGLVEYYIDSDEEYQPTWTWTAKGGNNHELSSTANWTVAQYNTGASGAYSFWYRFKTWGSSSSSDGCGDSYYIPTSNAKNQFTYKILPPALDGSDFTVTPSNLISGTGTDDDPFIIANNSSTTFTVSADQAHDDANSALWAKFGSGSYSSTLTSGSYAKSASKTSLTIKAKYRNNSASLDGAEVTKTIYYKEQPAGITVAAGSNGTVSIDGSSYGSSKIITPITFSTNYNIYAKGNTHYDFGSWSKTSNGTNTTIGSTTTANTTVSVSSGAVTTVTANFVEHPYTITIVGGTAASTTAKIVTTGTATAKAPFGMHFTGWTVPNSNFTLVGCTTSDETITFNATATGTVTANFAQTHAYIEGRFHVTNASRNGTWTNTFSSGDWKEDSRSIEFSYDSENHYYYLHTYATPKELTTNISDLTPWFYIKSSPSTSSWTNATVNRPHASGDANQQLTAAGDANKKSADGTSGSNSFRFNSTDESGYVVIGFKKFGITYDPYIYYWLEQTLEYNGNGNTGGSAPASKTYYDKGTSVQAKSNTYTKSGYSFSGWNTKANGSGSSVAASAWYTLNANTTFYAQWSENDYTVTVNAGTGGTVGASLTTTTITGHKDSKADLPTATPDPGYYFTGWTKTSGSVTFYNQSSANTAQVNGLTAAATVQANFAPIWALAGGLNGGSDWNVNDNKFTTYTTNASSHDEGQLSKSLDANSTYWIKLWNIQNSASYGLASGASTTDVYYATSNNCWTMTNASGNQNLYVHTAAAGTYDFYWDIETNQLYVHYPTSRYITSGQSDANGGTVTAVDGSSNNVWGGKFVADEATATFTAEVNTGYTFDGWFNNSDYAVGHKYADNGVDIDISGEDGEVLELSSIGADKSVYAKFTAKTYDVTLTHSGDGYSTGGTASVTARYNATAPSIASLPTAANGYAFMGYYTEEDGEGSQIVAANGTWQNVDGYTSDGKWVRDADTELFAYFKKAEITTLTFAADVVGTETTDSVTVTPTISPTPVGTTIVCWEVQYSNGTALSPQPVGRSLSGNTYRFKAPAASGTYKVEAKLRTGSSCGAGTILSTRTGSFQVAGNHTVTISYKSGSTTVAASSSVTANPLEWSEDITAPNDIFGYTFSRWDAGDGVTIKDDTDEDLTTSTSATIQVKATYDGQLTAVYTQKSLIYFKNTLNWSSVYVNFYGEDGYWDDKGSGNKSVTNRNKAMTRIGETDVWYFDYGAASITPTKWVAFTQDSQNGEGSGVQNFWASGTGEPVCYPARRSDDMADKAGALGFYEKTPMFVPLAGQTAVVKNESDGGKANYYNDGYWTTYTAGTGYTLEIYYDYDSSPTVKSIPFSSANELMPMTAVADLEASTTYRFQLKRDGDVYYGNAGTMTYASHGAGTGWEMSNEATRRNDADDADVFAMCKITTNASGEYTFNLSYSGNSSDPVQYRLRMEVDYPIASGDYRLVYSDATQTNPIKSAIVPNANNSKDTVSFFIRPKSTPVLKIQQSTVNPSTGAISWDNYSTISTSVDNSGTDALSKDSVYNICLTMDETGAISVEKVEGYSGSYYIRTDLANSKWDNYRSSDHLMTYSEYAAKKTGSDYTHYFMGFGEAGTNIKFVVANDYAPNISDTLILQTYRGGDSDHVDNFGNLKEGASANVRFMWDIRNNAAIRAYLAPAQNDGSKFLVLQGEASKLLDPDGNALADASGNNHGGGTNAIQFTDDQNWMYEAVVKAVPGGRVKLYATYHGSTFYFYGDDDESFTDTHAIELVGGSGEVAQLIRVVYDFKTDRLIAAWMPSDDEINATETVNADIMLVREHQEAGQQINLTGTGSISTNKTVYGVMRFNRYTLHNRSKEGVHAVLPAGDQKSQYERFSYFVSFPFDVKVGEIFGFGTIGRHWRLFYYDGLGRAQEGFFAERGSDNWKLIDDTDSVLHAYQGYMLQLNYIRMAYDQTSTGEIWGNNKEEVELYFPAMNAITTISLEDVVIPALSEAYKCTKDLSEVHGTSEADRRIKDSYWRCIGVPGFTSYTATASSWTNFNWTANEDELPYLYEWQMDDNKLSVVSSATFTFKPMHAYLVQNGNSFTWTNVAKPHAIIARQQQEPQYYEFRLELNKDTEAIDHTYIRLTDDEEVTTGFDFGQDLSKELSESNNLYTKVGYERLAANCLPMSDKTTIVPVGAEVASDGDYTFSIPEGTEGVGVTLIDKDRGIRTNLSAVDYTVSLEAGTYDERFVIEISPIQHMPTEVETSDIRDQKSDVRKVLIDGLLYIVRDNKVYDARGARVE